MARFLQMEGKTLRQQRDDGSHYCGVLELDPHTLRGVPVALVGSGCSNEGHRLDELVSPWLIEGRLLPVSSHCHPSVCFLIAAASF